MAASDEGRAYVNVNQETRSVSAVDTSEASLRTYRLVAVSFCVLCVLQVALNVTLCLYANVKSDIQTNISLLTEENNQLQVSYTKLLTDNQKLQKKLEAKRKFCEKMCANDNRTFNFTTEKDSQQDLVDNLRQELNYTQHTLLVEVSRRLNVEGALRKKHRENAQLKNEINILRGTGTGGG
ncbi:hypothetical protein KOW79_021653 [Hemibagrus wyckioides]|uniref:Uncharacterized protein n=1 Tax=Hemibagrus wyckioides TaxID=337641 RepID=A0A9D3N2M4_9TELE|nr:hypothetical protein KOW79_021653 [Hemibagrus wyckioides]